MLYLRSCYDRADAGTLRDELRALHRAYLAPFVGGEGPVRLIQAGPICVSDADDTNLGSFMIIEAPSLAAAQELHDGDPFTKAGIFARVDLHRWDRHIGG